MRFNNKNEFKIFFEDLSDTFCKDNAVSQSETECEVKEKVYDCEKIVFNFSKNYCVKVIRIENHGILKNIIGSKDKRHNFPICDFIIFYFENNYINIAICEVKATWNDHTNIVEKFIYSEIVLTYILSILTEYKKNKFDVSDTIKKAKWFQLCYKIKETTINKKSISNNKNSKSNYKKIIDINMKKNDKIMKIEENNFWKGE